MPEWYSVSPPDTSTHIYGRGVCTKCSSSYTGEEKAVDEATLEIARRVKIYSLDALNDLVAASYLTLEPAKLKKCVESASQEVMPVAIHGVETVKISEGDHGSVYVLCRLSKEHVDRSIEATLESMVESKKRLMLRDTQGNPVAVWVTKSENPSATEIIRGEHIGPSPTNLGYFDVDLEPCVESGLVPIPGEVKHCKHVKDTTCANGEVHGLHEIEYERNE